MLKLLDLAGKSAKSSSFNTLFLVELLKLLDLAVSEFHQLHERVLMTRFWLYMIVGLEKRVLVDV